MLIDTLVEGVLDEAVAVRLIEHCGHVVGSRFGRNGVRYLERKIGGFNARSAYGNPILALVDLMDTRVGCPPQLIARWLPRRNKRFLLRVVVRSIESWLLADREGIANLLGIRFARMPSNPEQLDHPKRMLIELARRSRRRDIRDGFLPPPTSSALVGPEYVVLLEQFVLRQWNPTIAAATAPSLARTIERLRELGG